MKSNPRLATPIFAAAVLMAGLVGAGCSSFSYYTDTTTAPSPEGDGQNLNALDIRLALLIPADNATDDENAGRAVTEMLGTALFERGIRIRQTEVLRKGLADGKNAGADGNYRALAESAGASHLIFGTVHEYRYKSDLDGDPAVGITLRIVDVATGETVWQGTSGNVGYTFASLTSSAQRSIRNLVGSIPLTTSPNR